MKVKFERRRGKKTEITIETDNIPARGESVFVGEIEGSEVESVKRYYGADREIDVLVRVGK